MDLVKEAQRLSSLATVFVWVGWLGVAWAFIAAILWWVDLVQKEAFNFLEALAISSAAVGQPLFTAIVLAAIGHALRLFALSTLSKNQ